MEKAINEKNIIELDRKANKGYKKFLRNKSATIGLIIVVFMMTLAIFAPLFAPADPNQINLEYIYSAPGENGFILGSDENGRDLLSRIIYGGRISMGVAFGATLFAGVIGTSIGLIAGFEGGKVDSIIMRIIDGMFAFPFVLLALVLMTVLGSGVFNLILAIGISSIPGYARIARGQVHAVKNEEYCNVMRVIGAKKSSILFRHILPNCFSPLIVYGTLGIAGAIISEASLSFLGLGVEVGIPTWGNILYEGRDVLSTYPYIATFSGLAIFITVIGFNLLGDGIRDVLDPKMKV